jgi:hypothetical protein
MKTLVFLTLILALPVYGQKIETRDPSRNGIIQVKTALHHLTVVQLAEPALSVAAGSDAFKVEWRGTKVFIEPIEAGVSTNLFIWTKSGRQNYELEPAGSAATMDFAIDTRAVDPAPKPKAKPKTSTDPTKSAIEEMLRGMPIQQASWKMRKHRVQVMVRDLFTENGELFVRYSIENGTKRPYTPGAPHVALLACNLPHALAAQAYTQLSAAESRSLITQSETPLAVKAHAATAKTVLPGHKTVGVVSVSLPISTPAVVRLEFRSEHGRTVRAAVVI